MKVFLPTLVGVAAGVALSGCGRGSSSLVDSSAASLRTVDVAPILTSSLAPVIDADTVDLNFELDGEAKLLSALELKSYSCKLADDVAFRDCSAKPFKLEGLEDAKAYNLTVRANLLDKTSKEELLSQDLVLNFAVDIPGGVALDPAHVPTDPTRVSALSTRLQLGTSYVVEVAKDLHVTEYWNQLSYGGSSWYRVLPESDAHYMGVGNRSCEGSLDTVVDVVSPSGRWYSYCKSNAQLRDFDLPYQGTEGYIEVATDSDLVTSTNHERFFVSTYNGSTSTGSGYDVMYDADGYMLQVPSGLRKFAQVCQGKDVDFIDVPMVNNFFLGRSAETVRFWYCDAILPNTAGEPTAWKVGAFVERDQADAYCSACNASARTIEAVYMLRPSEFTHLPAYFARRAQERIGSMLLKVLP